MTDFEKMQNVMSLEIPHDSGIPLAKETRYRGPRFHRGFKMGLELHAWIVVWKWRGKWRHFGLHENYDSLRRPW